ncbi:hypothetical protein dqs_1430 [Azoarcus olearius]|uniref:type VI secretion system protein TssA n=1 Tax=Azoarcus sp. (strain BH72) TaxID=418699 RepID=UPI00080614F5|nr:type VI secretion system protein TssA [Azoarcus olearius]ANQ84478.1 hypothetical protein dqs_1430 [Azoarcus olearius]
MDEAEFRAGLMAPISAANPAGEDLCYTPLFDDIRNARHADDDALGQGEWTHAVKAADWPRVVELCRTALCARSKDLQLAVWYVDALVRHQHWPALEFGLGFLSDLLDGFWAVVHPLPDGGDWGERTARLEWLGRQLADQVAALPLIADEVRSYSLHDYRTAIERENRPDADSAAGEPAAAIDAERLRRAFRAADTAQLMQRRIQLAATLAAASRLQDCCDQHFGMDGPSFAALQAEIGACDALLSRHLRPTITPPQSSQASPPARLHGEPDRPPSSRADDGRPPSRPYSSDAPPLAPLPDGAPPDRDAAIRQLAEIGRFFRVHEPHSPVALLIERAVRWAGMPFEDWLQAVVKDAATLDHLRELLDLPPGARN